MSKYLFSVNTDKYVCHRCSQKNWEPGTKNDYMLAINGIKRKLNNIKEVNWQLELFQGNYCLSSEYSEDNPKENDYLSNEYCEFLKKNTIAYYDKLCGFERKQYLSGYGFLQGYFSVGGQIEKLKKERYIKIPFSWLYDRRQYDKNMNGCYIEIKKI